MDLLKTDLLLIIVIPMFYLYVDIQEQPQLRNQKDHIDEVFEKAISKMKDWTMIRCNCLALNN